MKFLRNGSPFLQLDEFMRSQTNGRITATRSAPAEGQYIGALLFFEGGSVSLKHIGQPESLTAKSRFCEYFATGFYDKRTTLSSGLTAGLAFGHLRSSFFNVRFFFFDHARRPRPKAVIQTRRLTVCVAWKIDKNCAAKSSTRIPLGFYISFTTTEGVVNMAGPHGQALPFF